mmetsp:Transcript_11433/g.16173  ORF Transcript_11433/g.16173 Transcript_11433/m.16173 type:complete len:96 (+) Transcript_11433:277-564(+)
MWVWTEPHSMRFKIRLTIRADLQSSITSSSSSAFSSNNISNTTLQQRILITLHVKFKQCPDCNREYTNRTWQALVQIRQKNSHNNNSNSNSNNLF